MRIQLIISIVVADENGVCHLRLFALVSQELIDSTLPTPCSKCVTTSVTLMLELLDLFR
jgi:hypothetical protein